MATLNETFTNIANAIRNRTGKSSKITPVNFIGEINSIFERWKVNSDPQIPNTLVKIYNSKNNSYVEQGYTNSAGQYSLVNNISGMVYRVEVFVNGKNIQTPLTCVNDINNKNFWIKNTSPYICELTYYYNRCIRMAACEPTNNNSAIYMSFVNPNEFRRYDANRTYTTINWGNWYPDIMISGKKVFTAGVLGLSPASDINVINLSGTMTRIDVLNVYGDTNRMLNTVSGGPLTKYAVLTGYCGNLKGTGNGTEDDIYAWDLDTYTRNRVHDKVGYYKSFPIPHTTGLLIVASNQDWSNNYILKNNVDFLDQSLTFTKDMDLLPIYISNRAYGGIVNRNTVIVIDKFDIQETNYNVSYHFNKLLRYDSSRTRSWITVSTGAPRQLSYFGTIGDQTYLFAYEYRIRKMTGNLTIDNNSYGEAFWDSVWYKYCASNNKYACCWADNGLWIMTN